MSTNLMSERISIHIIVPNLPWRSKTKNFLSIFCRPPPTPPAEEKKKGKENFWFLLPRPKGADEAHPFASPRNRSVRFRFKPPRARSARHHLFWKYGLTWYNKDTINELNGIYNT